MSSRRGARRSFSGSARLLVLGAMLLAGCAGRRSAVPAGPKLTASERYARAQELIEKKSYARARQILTDIGVRELQDTALDPLVKVALADAFFRDGGIENIAEAQGRYEQFLSFYPTHEKSAYAQYQLGMCLFEQSARPQNDQEYTRKAIAEFRKVRLVDPSGEWAAAADGMVLKAEEKLARHDYLVGRFYFKRKAWEAAAGRFRSVLKDYPSFSDAPAAALHLGEALICSGNRAEGAIYLEKLLEDHPGGDLATRARRRLDSTRGC